MEKELPDVLNETKSEDKDKENGNRPNKNINPNYINLFEEVSHVWE